MVFILGSSQWNLLDGPFDLFRRSVGLQRLFSYAHEDFVRCARIWAPVATQPPLVLVDVPRNFVPVKVRKSRFPHILASLVGRNSSSSCALTHLRSPLASGSGIRLSETYGFLPLVAALQECFLRKQRKARAYM